MMKILCIAGRKEIIAEFRTLVSSFPEEMSTMQSELSKYKEAASDVHSLRADVQSLSRILERRVSIFFCFLVGNLVMHMVGLEPLSLPCLLLQSFELD